MILEQYLTYNVPRVTQVRVWSENEPHRNDLQDHLNAEDGQEGKI